MSPYWKKISITAGFILIAIIGCLLFLTRPYIDSYASHKQQYSDRQQDLLSLLDKMDALQKVNKNNASFEAKSNEVKTLWPDVVDVSRFMVQTEDLAKRENIVIENFSIQEKTVSKPSAPSSDDKDANEAADKPAPKGKSSTTTQFSFNTTAPFPTALNLIRSMETFPRFNSLSLIAITDKGDDGVEINLTGRLYYGK